MKEKPAQKLAGLIRERLAIFEESQRIGIPQQVIVDKLNDEGFVVNLATFRNGLVRARKARDKATAVASQVRPAKAALLDEAEKPKLPSTVLNLNQHGGFTMPPPLTPEEIF